MDRLLEVLAFKEVEEKHTLVLFREDSFAKANALAEEKRRNAERVTVQYEESVTDLDSFKSIFDEVIIVSECGSLRE